ncbi:hypothetical protein [Desulforhabdus sp. TSK]|uniref:hypothetical protein n=1 Tax=Desulforhabdus sp. TSK TaxID=2925014 RepID=UPI001FC84AFF|nr:hypothetical protein [Desulforhabdus sp. TSK]GKT06698.1 hypothetical protein DSTSK_00030 [Desulforhabdus sp. TSK]
MDLEKFFDRFNHDKLIQESIVTPLGLSLAANHSSRRRTTPEVLPQVPGRRCQLPIRSGQSVHTQHQSM